MKRSRELLSLFWEFFQFGCFTFGGGWSIVAQMQRLYVEERKVISSEELLDLTSVGRSLPGTMVGNVAMLYGCHVAGPVGGVVCVLGLVIPPMLILTVITCFYTAFRSSRLVAAAMTGVRAAVVPIIAAAAAGMRKGSFRYPPCVVIALLAFALYLFWNVSCVWLVVMGALGGVAISEWYERKGGAGHGAA